MNFQVFRTSDSILKDYELVEINTLNDLIDLIQKHSPYEIIIGLNEKGDSGSIEIYDSYRE